MSVHPVLLDHDLIPVPFGSRIGGVFRDGAGSRLGQGLGEFFGTGPETNDPDQIIYIHTYILNKLLNIDTTYGIIKIKK